MALVFLVVLHKQYFLNSKIIGAHQEPHVADLLGLILSSDGRARHDPQRRSSCRLSRWSRNEW